jgi:hypothetical protein
MGDDILVIILVSLVIQLKRFILLYGVDLALQVSSSLLNLVNVSLVASFLFFSPILFSPAKMCIYIISRTTKDTITPCIVSSHSTDFGGYSRGIVTPSRGYTAQQAAGFDSGDSVRVGEEDTGLD